MTGPTNCWKGTRSLWADFDVSQGHHSYITPLNKQIYRQRSVKHHHVGQLFDLTRPPHLAWGVKRLIESTSTHWIGLCTVNRRGDAGAASTNIQLYVLDLTSILVNNFVPFIRFWLWCCMNHAHRYWPRGHTSSGAPFLTDAKMIDKRTKDGKAPMADRETLSAIG